MSDAIQSAILAAFSAALERAISQAVATHVQDLQTRLDDLADRTAQLEGDISHNVQVQQANIVAALAERIAKLESAPTEASLSTQLTSTTAEDARLVDLLDRQGWFWEKLQNRIDSTVEAAMDSHLEGYDHDSYDSAVSAVEDVDLDDVVTKDDVNDAVREALDGLRVTLSL